MTQGNITHYGSDKLNCGYIIDDGDLPYSVWDLVEKSRDSHVYRINCFIVQKTKLSTKKEFVIYRIINLLKKHRLSQIARLLYFKLFLAFEKSIVVRNKKLRDVIKFIPIDQMGIKVISVHPEISPSGFVYRYNDEDIKKIKDLGLDLLVRGGSGILRGDILKICPLGIISFHHADNDINRGGPAGFWEVYNREPSTGFVIQRLEEELDGGEILFKGSIPTAHYYFLNMSRLYLKSNIFMHKILEKIGNSSAELIIGSGGSKTPYSYPLYKSPTLTQILYYSSRTIFYFIRNAALKILKIDERWGVAFQFCGHWSHAVLWKSTTIKNPPGRFLADPFVVSKEGRKILFVEDYYYNKHKGIISAYEIRNNDYNYLGTALEEAFHLSFPFIFEAENHLFMCPETNSEKEIRLYKCIEFPLQWRLHAVLKKNISAVDTVIFEHSGKWWMLSNCDTSKLGENTSELHVFYSDSFDSQEWLPHEQNPVIFDSKRARNGGFFKIDNELYRVYQVQGFNNYGESMGIAKINKLSETEYEENDVCVMAPKFFNNLRGAHSFSYADGVIAIDFKRNEIINND